MRFGKVDSVISVSSTMSLANDRIQAAANDRIGTS